MDAMRNCRVCLGRCDPATHEATARVHLWLRERLKHALPPPPVVTPSTHPPLRPPLAAIREARSPAAKRKAAAK